MTEKYKALCARSIKELAERRAEQERRRVKDVRDYEIERRRDLAKRMRHSRGYKYSVRGLV